jgi:hypothetical protein
MKKTIIITTVALLVAAAYLVSPSEGKGWFEKDKTEKCKMEKGKPMMGMCPMHKMMSEHMMKKEIVADGDGGVIIMACGKLYKYDKDLNLVKDVELTKIHEDAKAKMEEMKKECAEKCKMKMTKKMSKAEEESEEEAEEM